ncbi:MAG: AMP-dependent synthetase/ligase [Actinomycetota bacterium]
MTIPGDTLVEIFVNRAEKSSELIAAKWRRGSEWKAMTFGELGKIARDLAGGLMTLGVEKGDPVALLSGNRPEWILADIATMMAGGVTVPVYPTSPPNQVAYILDHCRAKVAFVENQEQLDKIIKVKDRLSDLARVIMFDKPLEPVDWVSSIAEVQRFADSAPQKIDERMVSIVPDDLATIVYTSGTTGPPKGTMLTHGGFVAALRPSGQVLGLRDGEERVLSYLPLSHIFERLNSGWGGICFGMEVWFAESLDTLLDNLKDCKPTFFIGVPRVFEKFHAGMRTKIEAHPKRHLIEKAIGLGLEQIRLEQAGRQAPVLLKLKRRVLDRLVLSKLREGIGMQEVRVAVTGGAPIEPEVINFIRAIGVELVEGYGQTETNAPTAITPPGKVRSGAVGPPIPGLELKFEPDGEILVRGPNVFKGYYKDKKATKEALSPEGFLRTGDVGELDDAGYLRITDRKKDLIKTAGGKYIAPQAIESKLKLDALIGQALVIGDRRPYPTALLTLDAEAAVKWADDHGVSGSPAELSENPDVLSRVEEIVAAVNANLSHAEQIKKWRLLSRDFTQEDEEITPTLKVKRKVLIEKHAALIESMYDAGAPEPNHPSEDHRKGA